MPITLTDEYIADTYQGVIHSQGAELSGSGSNGEVTMLHDGVGNETSVAIGKKGAGLSVYCDISACGTLYLSGAEIRNIIDSRMYWSYDPASDFIRQKTLTYDSQPIIGTAVQRLSADSLTAGGYTYPTTAIAASLSSIMVLGANNVIEFVPRSQARALFNITKDRVVFCAIDTTNSLPITFATLNAGAGAYSTDRISGDTLKVVGIRHYGNKSLFSVISYSKNVVVSANLRYEVAKYTFDGAAWVSDTSNNITGELSIPVSQNI